MAKKRNYKKLCDRLWQRLIKARARYRCELCGAESSQLHAHHLIPRQAVFFRHNLNNGVCLCPRCHTFNYGQGSDNNQEAISAHGTPWAFEDWLREHKPDQYAWFTKNRHKVFTGVKINYEQVYEQLLEAERDGDGE